MRILKRVSLCVLLALTASILSGCIRVDCDITVKDNGKADISVLFAMQGMTEGEGSLFDDEELAALRKEGWEVTDYAEDDYGGFIVSQKNVELSEIPLLDGEGSLRKEGSLYILDLYLAEDEDSQSLMESGSMIKGAGGYYTVHLTLPSKPVKHNATSVSEDGKTLEWDLFSMKTSDPIHVEYRQSSYMWLIAVLAVLAAIVGALLVTRKKRPAGTTAPASIPEVPGTPRNEETAEPFMEEPGFVQKEAAADGAPETPAVTEPVPVSESSMTGPVPVSESSMTGPVPVSDPAVPAEENASAQEESV